MNEFSFSKGSFLFRVHTMTAEWIELVRNRIRNTWLSPLFSTYKIGDRFIIGDTVLRKNPIHHAALLDSDPPALPVPEMNGIALSTYVPKLIQEPLRVELTSGPPEQAPDPAPVDRVKRRWGQDREVEPRPPAHPCNNP